MKLLVICCDDTWNAPDQKGDVTNVLKMARAIPPKSPRNGVQITYYDEGVGTGNAVDRFLGGTMGLGLNKNIIQAYQFLVHNFEDGDKIAMFGFSRGAYTVRSLAGLVAKMGILHKKDSDQLPEFYERYRTKRLTPEFLKEKHDWIYARPDIAFLGVWDTVGSLGIPFGGLRWIGQWRYNFHDVELNEKITYACHALAVDEQRGPFKPTLWKTTNDIGDSILAERQTVRQVWFPGVHSNVGGGYGENLLSNRTFLWMVNEARSVVDFDEIYLEHKIDRQSEDRWGDDQESRKGKWKLLPRHVRPLGGDCTERVHRSVARRAEHARRGQFERYPYRPGNYAKFRDDLTRWGDDPERFIVD
ncbi:DUF2235 domain-containing protein [Jiella pelagia]|uniref:DUF2235 domain-containing protein n=1 Tax=Jiella pelagia TaxID=2986949 RepID=A0ABY7BW50_9HYPH|nr:DUF2235 domain-containing protein [Jiella pelagia]WAP67146.1 DUF2235 domain-containing protein [Jiella pelagia]